MDAIFIVVHSAGKKITIWGVSKYIYICNKMTAVKMVSVRDCEDVYSRQGNLYIYIYI